MPDRKSTILHRRSGVEIILLDKGCPGSSLASSHLAEYLKRCLDIPAAVVHEKQSGGNTALYLGPLSAQRANGRLRDTAPENGLGPEALLIKTTAGEIVLSGGSGTGVLYAAYAFIERFLGVRFLGLDAEEWVPTPESVAIPHMEITEEPALALRGGALECRLSDEDFLKTIDWMAKNRLNYLAFVALELAPMMKRMIAEVRARGIHVSLGGHGLDSFLYNTWRLPRGEEYERIAREKLRDHPEWHCLKTGRRVLCGRSLGNFCLSCDEAVDEFCRNVIEFVREYPFLYSLYICFNDAQPVFCECEKCRGHSLGNITQRFYNHVADRLHKVYPELVIVIVAYADCCIPPSENTPLSRNISIDMDLWKQDYRHGIGADVPKHKRFMRLVEKWLDFAKRCGGNNSIGLAQYYSYVMCSLGPRANVMFEDARLCRHLGISAIWDCLLPYALTYGFPKVLTPYLLARALWNPDADREKTVAELLDPILGEASETMKQVLRISDQLGAICLAPVWWRWKKYPLNLIQDSISLLARTLVDLQRVKRLLGEARRTCDTSFGTALIAKSEKWLAETAAKVGDDKILLEALEMIIARLDQGGDIAERCFVEAVASKLMTAQSLREKRKEIINMSSDVAARTGEAFDLPGDIARWICGFTTGEDAVLANIANMSTVYNWQGCSFARKEQGCDDCCIISCPDYLEGPGRKRYRVRE